MDDDLRFRFAQLHRQGTFVMPNPWDVGSAKILAAMGFPALATTSSGFALTLGRHDQEVTLGELLDHSRAMAEAVGVPLNVDSERCFADTLPGVADTVRAIAETGAAGCSIEDYDPETDAIDPITVATDRVGAAAEAARSTGLILTARAENHLYGAGDLDDTIDRLRAYRSAGAHVVYAPGLVAMDDIRRVVEEVDAPVNVLARPDGPATSELAAAGVRRISTGGALARNVYADLIQVANRLAEEGRVSASPSTSPTVDDVLG